MYNIVQKFAKFLDKKTKNLLLDMQVTKYRFGGKASVRIAK